MTIFVSYFNQKLIKSNSKSLISQSNIKILAFYMNLTLIYVKSLRNRDIFLFL